LSRRKKRLKTRSKRLCKSKLRRKIVRRRKISNEKERYNLRRNKGLKMRVGLMNHQLLLLVRLPITIIIKCPSLEVQSVKIRTSDCLILTTTILRVLQFIIARQIGIFQMMVQRRSS
jgi:hypothetical protein